MLRFLFGLEKNALEREIAVSQRHILVTAALPYANGHIHVGHLVEYIQADIWSRFQKMRGHDCIYLCADDTHGTPIMIRARQEGVSPEEWIAKCHKEHEKDFEDFDVEFDEYHTTHGDENKETVEYIFKKIEEKGLVTTKPVKQPYCEHDKMFLPDRFVKGICPKCGAQDQYGDSCDTCGSTYSPTELKEAHCAICGNSPVERESEHVFYKLNEHKGFLKEWVQNHTSEAISKKLMEWLEGDLRDWDISRDAPYFGFEIPGHPEKYFYVWADAPVGYIGTTKKWCARNNRSYEEFWKSDKAEIYHFIGKDIAYHHTLFWPFMLHNAELNTPNEVFVHGMLTVNGEKMSKSKGTFINARTYLKHAEPTYLRYYYATKLTNGIDDFDLSFEDFVNRVNSELVGKITNLASRGAQMLGKKIDGKIGKLPEEGRKLLEEAQSRSEVIAQLYEAREYSKAMIEIRQLADAANRYFDDKEPWKMIKEDVESTREVLSTILNVFRVIAIYLKPVIPSYVKKVEKLFKEDPYSWDDAQKTLEDWEIGKFKHLAQRLELKQLEKIVKDEQKNLEKATKKTEKSTKKSEKKAATSSGADEGMIEFSDFMKVDLRVAKIIEAEEITESKKLLRLKVQIGDLGEREILAGIRSAYKAEDLVGRLTVVVANLAPRKMKFGVSEGMVIAAGPGDSEIFILSPDSGAQPGQRVQ